MAWFLLLAHFIADYPLQPAWMVRNKTRLWVLLLHVSIHFGVMSALFWAAFPRVWQYLALLAFIHFWIDVAKNWCNAHLSRWNSWSYLVDQALHIVSIILLAYWINSLNPPVLLPISRALAVYLTGFLLATYVWLVTERVLTGGRLNGKSLTGIQLAWPRLFIRAGILVLLLGGWKVLQLTAAGLVIPQPYPATANGMRALLIDVAVSSAAATIIIMAAH